MTEGFVRFETSKIVSRFTVYSRHSIVPVLFSLRDAWGFWLALALVLTGFGIGMFEGIDRLLVQWSLIWRYGHGYLTLGMAIWLLPRYVARGSITIQPSLTGAIGLAITTLAYAAFEFVDLTFGLQSILPLILVSIVAALGGVALAYRVAIPIGFLYFGIPIWDIMVPYLVATATWVVQSILPLFGVSAFISGNVITLASGSFEVADGCSGLNFFITALTLAAFFSILWYEQLQSRVIFVGIAVAVAIASNWVRILSIILIGHATDMTHYLVREDHQTFGFVLFYVLMIPPFWIAQRWADKQPADSPDHIVCVKWAPQRTFLISGILLSLLLISPVWSSSRTETEPAGIQLEIVLGNNPDWTLVSTNKSWNPKILTPDEILRTALKRNDSQQVDILVARYFQQRQQSKLISTHNHIEGGWHITSSRTRNTVSGGFNRSVKEFEIVLADKRRLLWVWYQVGGVWTHSRIEAKMYEFAALFRDRNDGAVTAISIECSTTCDYSGIQLEEVLHTYGSELERLADGGITPSVELN